MDVNYQKTVRNSVQGKVFRIRKSQIIYERGKENVGGELRFYNDKTTTDWDHYSRVQVWLAGEGR